MFRKTLLALLLTASGLAHSQIPISGLPNATVPLGSADQIIVNQKVTATAYSTRQAPLSALAPFFPSLTSHYILQAADPTLTQSRVLTGTANQVILADGGPLGNLTLSLPQSIATTSSPTFTNLTLTGTLGAVNGTFSGTLSANSLSLTTPLPATSGGTGFGSYAVGDLLAASTTTALSKLSDVAVGSYLRSGGVSTLPLWSTLTLPNAATTGDVLIATGTNAIGSLADVTVGSYLRSNGAGAAPVYSTVKIPNAAVIGDIWYGSAASTISALTGNITTGVQFLAQTGSGAASAAPVWTTLPGSFTGFANPSGLIGLTAVNGVATTADRSDSTHAIDQSIAPTWTGTHTWQQTVNGNVNSTFQNSSAGTAATARILLANSANSLALINSSTGFSGSVLTGGPTGESGSLFTTAAIPVVIGTAGAARIVTSSIGGVTLNAPTSGDSLTIAAVSGGRSFFANYVTGTGPSNVVFQTQVPNGSASIWRLSQSGIANLDFSTAATTGVLSIINGGVTAQTMNLAGGNTFPNVGTTASAANAFLDNAAGNNLLRSTSSLRYKSDITTMTDMASDIIYNLRPVRFHSKASADSHTAWFYGLVAEEVAVIEPSLIVKDAQGRPDGVQYDRLQVFMLPEVQKMRKEIDFLKLQVYALWLLTAFSIGFTVVKTRRR